MECGGTFNIKKQKKKQKQKKGAKAARLAQARPGVGDKI
jgi:hypothetical protein